MYTFDETEIIRDEPYDCNMTDEQAIDDCVIKWQGIVDHLKTEPDDVPEPDISSCALCFLYRNSACHGCPIRLKTGVGCCHKTPYNTYTDLQDVKPIPYEALISAAEQEVAFLKSLKGGSDDSD